MNKKSINRKKISMEQFRKKITITIMIKIIKKISNIKKNHKKKKKYNPKANSTIYYNKVKRKIPKVNVRNKKILKNLNKKLNLITNLTTTIHQIMFLIELKTNK